MVPNKLLACFCLNLGHCYWHSKIEHEWDFRLKFGGGNAEFKSEIRWRCAERSVKNCFRWEYIEFYFLGCPPNIDCWDARNNTLNLILITHKPKGETRVYVNCLNIHISKLALSLHRKYPFSLFLLKFNSKSLTSQMEKSEFMWTVWIFVLVNLLWFYVAGTLKQFELGYFTYKWRLVALQHNLVEWFDKSERVINFVDIVGHSISVVANMIIYVVLNCINLAIITLFDGYHFLEMENDSPPTTTTQPHTHPTKK